MAMQSYTTDPARIDRFKGATLKHAVPREVLAKAGKQVEMPKNNSRTYIARRWLPYGGVSTNANTQNQFFAAGNGNRDTAMVQANQIAEGVTPSPDSIQPVDFTAIINEYGCLYGYTDVVADMYEDDIPKQMATQVGERMALVNEMICYGALRACTNQYFGGTGTTTATVNGALTLGLVRNVAKNLMANHGVMPNKVLSASNKYGTSPVPAGFMVFCHTDLEPDIRDLPNFIPAEKYASGSPMPNELGMCERFRFITSPDLPSVQNGGAAVGSTGLISTSGSNIDVYTIIVTAEDAWSQIALRGKQSIKKVALLTPDDISKSDPLGQRGYAGAIWYKACLIENPGWMATAQVGAKTLS